MRHFEIRAAARARLREATSIRDLDAVVARVDALADQLQRQVCAAATCGCLESALLAVPSFRPDAVPEDAKDFASLHEHAADPVACLWLQQGHAQLRECERVAALLSIGLQGGNHLDPCGSWRGALSLCSEAAGQTDQLDIPLCLQPSALARVLCMDGAAGRQAGTQLVPDNCGAKQPHKRLLGVACKLQKAAEQLGGRRSHGRTTCKVFVNPCYLMDM